MRARWTAALTLALVLALPRAARALSIREARDRIVSETLAYLNVPYLWGGTHPDTGIDCSAFVQLVFSRAGLRVPRVAGDQFRATVRVAPDKVLPGDLIFFAMKSPGTAQVTHVGIYVGRGLFIHASVTHGVHIESISKPYYLDRLVGVRRFGGF